ncbi:DUF4288 domain-containing protein [Neisseria sp. 23W00296]|uniref:DUF4288 domain-containing protein n=1 Tax=unclassified Neisseria TaxID=2623750 RepID=UPI0002A1B289|nr:MULTISPECIES: DUF4288 domain-containing protein [unclassified Neisseria]ASP16496.1 DUF4288 domain-containing protein [Neisseria sp. KEM232]EKY05492.1 hypothetical protein HMPREF9120_01834 [Neisseria sp. oral taxon 020 str. F0370]
MEKYFCVGLLYCSIRNGMPADDDWFEESLVLIRALDSETAKQAAAAYAAERETAYRSMSDDSVRWHWLGITGVFDVCDSVSTPEGRAEVFSRMLKRHEIPAVVMP